MWAFCQVEFEINVRLTHFRFSVWQIKEMKPKNVESDFYFQTQLDWWPLTWTSEQTCSAEELFWRLRLITPTSVQVETGKFLQRKKRWRIRKAKGHLWGLLTLFVLVVYSVRSHWGSESMHRRGRYKPIRRQQNNWLEGKKKPRSDQNPHKPPAAQLVRADVYTSVSSDLEIKCACIKQRKKKKD